jgi:hypothetical protein
MNDTHPFFDPSSPLYLPYLVDDGTPGPSHHYIEHCGGDPVLMFKCFLAAIFIFTVGVSIICIMAYLDYHKRQKEKIN